MYSIQSQLDEKDARDAGFDDKYSSFPAVADKTWRMRKIARISAQDSIVVVVDSKWTWEFIMQFLSAFRFFHPINKI